MFGSFLQNGIVLVNIRIVMDALVFLLNELENSGLSDEKTRILRVSDHCSVSLIEAQASGVLITNQGSPNFDMMDQLYADHGYFVFPGERDRFGWITACIQTKKGIIVFG